MKNMNYREKEKIKFNKKMSIWFNSNNLMNLRKLLDSGFDINIKDEDGNTAIFKAETNKSMFLIENGIDLNIKNKKKMNALLYAYLKKDVEKIKLISNSITKEYFDNIINNAISVSPLSYMYHDLKGKSHKELLNGDIDISLEEYIQINYGKNDLFHLFKSIKEKREFESLLDNDKNVKVIKKRI